MSEWNPQVVKLEKIERHPEADTLEISTVLGGYVVVFKEGRFKEGDLAAYVPVDSVCSNHPEFDWLGDKKRIKAVRLRGIFSLGILATAPEGMVEGDSIVDFYDLKKYLYEEEEPDVLGRHGGEDLAAPKGWSAPHYDLKGLRQYSRLLNEGEEVIIFEKLEGCNAAFAYALGAVDGNSLWVKSRNYYKKEDANNLYWQAAYLHNLGVALENYPGKVFYAELYGQVKGFRYDAPVNQGKVHPCLRFFDVWDTENLRFLDWDDAEKLITEAGLKTVPLLYRGPWIANTVTGTIVSNPLWIHAEGQSTLGANVREGFVVRPVKERLDSRHGRVVMKLKGQDFYLKKK